MEYILYGMIVFCFAVPIAIVAGVFVTEFMDWNYKRKYGAWEELKRTSYERRRPAAK